MPSTLEERVSQDRSLSDKSPIVRTSEGKSRGTENRLESQCCLPESQLLAGKIEKKVSILETRGVKINRRKPANEKSGFLGKELFLNSPSDSFWAK